MDLQELSDWFRDSPDDLTDTRIPGALSNDENKFLEENIEAKMKEMSSLQINIDEHKDRIQMLEDHQRMIEDELGVIQRLLAACRTEETTERSHGDIDTAEFKRLDRLISNLENDLKRFTARKNDFQIEIDQLHTQITTINDETITDKDAQEKLIDTMKKRDEEAFTLIRYTRQDDIRIKELTAELERYSEKSVQFKRMIEEELIEYSGFQVELDKLADQFRRSHHQRQQLIKRWETILVQMQRKDYDIDTLAAELLEIKSKGRTKEHELDEQKLFYDREQKNNIMLEKWIDLANQRVVILKAKQRTNNENQEHCEANLFSLKTILINTNNRVQRERAFLNGLDAQILTKQQNLTTLKQRCEQILARKRGVLNEKFSTEEKFEKFEKLMADEQKYQTNLNKQHQKATKKLFALHHELLLIRQREKQYEIANQASGNQIHSAKTQINQLDQQLLKQQELIYHQDFLKQTIDRRLTRTIGEKSNEKNSESDLQLRELQTEYEKKRSQHDQLQHQMKILREELRIIKHDFDQLNEEKTEYKNKFLQLDLHTTLTDKLTKRLNIEKEDYLVEENLLNLELKRLKNHLHHSNETNFNLEQQHIELQRATRERRMEVQANSHVFRIRFNDERTKKVVMSTELAMRVTKIEKLKHRYETLNTDGENGRAQVQHVIKSALMKEDLLRQGDQLEALVIKAETELRALENTVQILKWNNMDVKRNFEKLNESSSEISEMKELEEHLRAITDQVKIRRKLLREKKHSPSESEGIKFEEEIEQIKNIISNKQQIRAKLDDEIEEYHVKINRTNQWINRVAQVELDIDVRLLRETNKKIEQQITSICVSTGDQTILDQLSSDFNFKFQLPPSKTKSPQTFSHLIPNLVNISIDGSPSRSTTSESTRSKKSL